MADGYMPDWAERIQEELSRYDRESMVGSIAIDQINYVWVKLRLVRRSWEWWKDRILNDLNGHGVDGERLYELIVEDYLEDRESQFMWVLGSEPDTYVDVGENGATITLSKDGEKVCSVCLQDGIVTYTDHVVDVSKSHCYPRDYETLTYDVSSFKEEYDIDA